MTAAEYLARERGAEERSEYYAGEIFAMAGGGRAHNRIGENVRALLWTSFRGRPCEEFGSDTRILVRDVGLTTYPDASALCGPLEYSDDQADTLVNPQLIVEVLFPSTASYDRGKKFELYRRLPSLQEYLLIEPDRAHADLYYLDDAGDWKLASFDGLDTVIELPRLACQLPLREVYAKVTLEEPRLR